ncbi:unnamed protein product [Ascophyllum nodosum]
MDQPGKVAISARGHVTSVCFLSVYSGRQVRLGVPAGVSQEKVTQISHPPSFYDECLISREEDSSVPFPRRNLCTITSYDSAEQGLYNPYKRVVFPVRFNPPKYRWVGKYP